MRLPLLLLALSLATHEACAQSSFPAAWAGRWEGTLTTTTPPDSVRNRIPISLLIAREDTGSAWTWRTVFNADTVRGLRPYRLIPRDIRKGWFATDEGNGIELEETWAAGTLISIFQVATACSRAATRCTATRWCTTSRGGAAPRPPARAAAVPMPKAEWRS